jgi:hypothetical protein
MTSVNRIKKCPCNFAGIIFVLSLVISGCQSAKPTVSQLDTGMIWVFHGVEANLPRTEQVVAAYRKAGVTSAVYIFDWKRPIGGLFNLMDYEGNKKKAQEVAENIAYYRERHPHQPIDLVGYSGGGGMVIMVVEALPENIRIRNILLVQSAISPDYDLTKVLNRIDGKLINYYCPLDWFFLGLGTSLFGTMDRVNVDAVGKVGFNIEEAVPDPSQRELVTQRSWTEDMRPFGHPGDHIGIYAPVWNENYIAPHLLPETRLPEQMNVR